MNSTSHDGHSAAAAAPALDPAWLRRPTLVFDNASESISERAERDLEATLQLLAERACYLTGASNVVIAQPEQDGFVCRANAGVAGPQVGATVAGKSGLISQCVRNRQAIISNGDFLGSGINDSAISPLKIRSSASMPLIDEEDEVVGLLYLTAERPSAFTEEDIAALTPISEAIVTAMAHAGAAKRALDEIARARISEQPKPEVDAKTTEASEPGAGVPRVLPAGSSPAVEPLRISNCHGCGFPVSEGRTLCVECEQAGSAEGHQVPAFFQAGHQDQGWLQTNFYTIGTLLMICLTVVILMLQLR